VIAQQLLDPGRNKGRVVCQLLSMLRVGGQEVEGGGKRGRDGVQSGEEEQRSDVEDLAFGSGRPSTSLFVNSLIMSLSSGLEVRSRMIFCRESHNSLDDADAACALCG
jgi:hypothetical protein